MSDNPLDRIQRQRQRKLSDAIVPFNLDDVINNPYAIRKLNEERELLFAEKEDLKQKLDSNTSELETLRLENQRLSSQLDEVKRRSFPIFITSIVSSLLIGIGVNIATSDANQQMGWVMIIIGIILEGVIFLLMSK